MLNSSDNLITLNTLLGISIFIIRIAVCVAAAIYCLRVVLRFCNIVRLSLHPPVIVELTPPAHLDKDHIAMSELFAVLYGVNDARSLLSRALLMKSTLSLEVASTKQEGIRYIVGVRAKDLEFFRHSIASYCPEVVCRELVEYLPKDFGNRKYKVLSLKQTGHFAYPLQSKTELESHDPIGYLTGLMTKLENDDMVGMQITITPTNSFIARRINKKIHAGKEFRSTLGVKKKAMWAARKLGFLLILPFILVPWIIYKLFIARPQGGNGVVSPAEQSLLDNMHKKLGEQQFQASIKAITISQSRPLARERIKSFRATFSTFTSPQLQSLVSRMSAPTNIRSKYRYFMYKHRLPSWFAVSSGILSVSEIASLYHFPHSVSARTENVIKSLSKTLPAPVSLKNGTKLDVLLGENVHHGSVTPIGLTAEERQRHVYVIGGTGNGKTTMLLYGIIQDIEAGEGLAVIDPHGDLAQTILKHIPPARIRDVVYINPDDLAHPVGLNLLELPKDLSEDDLAREKDLVTESTISVLRKLFSEDDSGGHRVEYILRNTIQTALTIPGATLFTIFDLLNNTTYREKMVRKLKDKQLKDFWNNELGKAGEFQRVKMTAGVTAKIGRFLFSASAKRILEQPVSTIDFDDILASNKILICNFSKGLIGEDTSALFGTTVLAKLQLAALRRARLDQAARQPFYLYVDEFQNFATMSFVQMLSEARKYKLFLIMAEQSTAQQDQQRLVDIILANVGTVVSFRSGSPADERFILPLFSPYIEPGEIASLTAYSFYVRIAAVEVQEPLSGVTVLLKSPGSDMAAGKVVESSRATHGNFHKVFNSKTIGQLPLAREGQEIDIATTSESDIEPVG